MMKNVKKILALLLCAVLLVGASVAGTMAYLTDDARVTNTFTVGKVAIELKEYQVNAQTGVMEVGDPVTGLTGLELVPGRIIQKNPFIQVAADSEICWLFVKIENGLGDKITINGLEECRWTPVEGNEDYYMYDAMVNAGATVPVFKSITVSTTADHDALDSIASKEIIITAYAIQAEGFGTAADAWDAGNKPKAEGGWIVSPGN